MLNEAKEEFSKANAIKQGLLNAAEENIIYEKIRVASRKAESALEVYNLSDHMRTKLLKGGFSVVSSYDRDNGSTWIISGWAG